MQQSSPKDKVISIKEKSELLKNGATFHWWPNEQTSLHKHKYFEFFVTTGDKALHELNFEKQELCRGVLGMIRPEDCHRFVKKDGYSCAHINFCVTREQLEIICTALRISVTQFEKIKETQLTLSREEFSSLSEKARILSLMTESKRAYADVIMCQLISQAVSLLFNKSILSEFDYPQWFAKLIEEIHSSDNTAVTVSDVYKIGGFSPPVMIKYFKKYTGKTVAAYLRDMKCERACILLSTTRLSTLEISTTLGYESLSHFNRIFKEYTGVSPAAFRNEFLDKKYK